ncbi:hypothetical protein NEFER02_0631 [Nematocida sp. LUAm2]|nr:hypothetical protein NEFER02_0631 [Nematocida sp. LUAm2]
MRIKYLLFPAMLGRLLATSKDPIIAIISPYISEDSYNYYLSPITGKIEKFSSDGQQKRNKDTLDLEKYTFVIEEQVETKRHPDALQTYTLKTYDGFSLSVSEKGKIIIQNMRYAMKWHLIYIKKTETIVLQSIDKENLCATRLYLTSSNPEFGLVRPFVTRLSLGLCDIYNPNQQFKITEVTKEPEKPNNMSSHGSLNNPAYSNGHNQAQNGSFHNMGGHAGDHSSGRIGGGLNGIGSINRTNDNMSIEDIRQILSQVVTSVVNLEKVILDKGAGRTFPQSNGMPIDNGGGMSIQPNNTSMSMPQNNGYGMPQNNGYGATQNNSYGMPQNNGNSMPLGNGNGMSQNNGNGMSLGNGSDMPLGNGAMGGKNGMGGSPSSFSGRAGGSSAIEVSVSPNVTPGAQQTNNHLPGAFGTPQGSTQNGTPGTSGNMPNNTPIVGTSVSIKVGGDGGTGSPVGYSNGSFSGNQNSPWDASGGNRLGGYNMIPGQAGSTLTPGEYFSSSSSGDQPLAPPKTPTGYHSTSQER